MRTSGWLFWKNASPVQDLNYAKQNDSELERSLAPLWKLTYYSCLMFDWCKPIQKGHLSTILRRILIFVSFIILFYLIANSICELITTIMNANATLRDILILLVTDADLPLTLITWATYLVRRNELLIFFRDWSLLEKQQKVVDYTEVKRLAKILYFIYFGLSCSMAISMVVMLAIFIHGGNHPSKESHDLLLYYYPNLSHTFYNFILHCLFFINTMWMIIFIAIIDIVPILVYYHAAKLIDSLENEIRQLRDSTKVLSIVNLKREMSREIQSIWVRFERIRAMIGRANDLFGPTIILNHGGMFYVNCTIAFCLFDMLKDPEEAGGFPSFVIGFFFFATRFYFGVYFMSQVYCSTGRLVASVSELSAQWCNSPVENDRHVIRSFLGRIQNIRLAACPSGYYDITPSILLTLLSLTISYIIVLLQTK